jgi:hypothetical protein
MQITAALNPLAHLLYMPLINLSYLSLLRYVSKSIEIVAINGMEATSSCCPRSLLLVQKNMHLFFPP